MTEPVQWLPDGSPHSPRFNDRYRSRTGALAQSLTVFLGASDLPQRWRGREVFTLLETGFGLGLNFLTTWAAWELDAQRCERLHFVSIEAYPVAPADILRNAQLPEAPGAAEPPLAARLPALAQELAQAWHTLQPGPQQFHFASGRVCLSLALGQVQPMLAQLDCVADAVYLDGFSPALNPDMWSFATLQAIERLCRPGTTLASYSVALAVRESLKQLGFSVRKCPGLPPKRHRLEALMLPK